MSDLPTRFDAIAVEKVKAATFPGVLGPAQLPRTWFLMKERYSHLVWANHVKVEWANHVKVESDGPIDRSWWAIID